MKESTLQKLQNLPGKQSHSKPENGFREIAFGKEKSSITLESSVVMQKRLMKSLFRTQPALNWLHSMMRGGFLADRSRKTDLKYSAAPDGIFP
ncbi:MAG: hypothetical protein II922_03375 [Succinimonas sp.]|nr:hypothetical protein [Succinimonas sp.]